MVPITHRFFIDSRVPIGCRPTVCSGAGKHRSFIRLIEESAVLPGLDVVATVGIDLVTHPMEGREAFGRHQGDIACPPVSTFDDSRSSVPRDGFPLRRAFPCRSDRFQSLHPGYAPLRALFRQVASQTTTQQ